MPATHEPQPATLLGTSGSSRWGIPCVGWLSQAEVLSLVMGMLKNDCVLRRNREKKCQSLFCLCNYIHIIPLPNENGTSHWDYMLHSATGVQYNLKCEWSQGFKAKREQREHSG